ncbi:hypothetical protein C9374_013913 [Naegleria lovaniensis]|uniref:Uncharacterized protein n=1 Tax=Naegleria lovaniensis TaxID=51637 RepID=A0AA88H1L4_NAELO|nr:uncharacterized protein C9374_013913 [Naegleria lovaniensis]KAG2389353.1 hypothetical protein C9374_013913 [Naegleria lovaniensis]
MNALPSPVGPPIAQDLQLELGFQLADIDPRNQLFYILARRNDSNVFKEELLGLSLTNGQIVKQTILHTIVPGRTTFGRAQYLNVNPMNGDVFVVCNLTPNIHLFSLLKISFKGDQSNITILNHGFSGIGSNDGLSAFDFKNNVLVISFTFNPTEDPSLVALDGTTGQILKIDPNKGLMNTLTFDAKYWIHTRTLQVRKIVYIEKLSTRVLFYGGSLDTVRRVMYCFMSKIKSLEVDLVTIEVDTGKVVETSPVLILPQNLLVYNGDQ